MLVETGDIQNPKEEFYKVAPRNPPITLIVTLFEMLFGVIRSVVLYFSSSVLTNFLSSSIIRKSLTW